MKYLIMALSVLPLLASCEIESVYEPTAPRVQVEQSNRHEHASRNRVHVERSVQRHPESRVIVREEPANRPEARIEVSRNNHGRGVVRAPGDNVHRKGHLHKKPGPAVDVELKNNVHGHPAPPRTRVDVQNNVHGHD